MKRWLPFLALAILAVPLVLVVLLARGDGARGVSSRGAARVDERASATGTRSSSSSSSSSSASTSTAPNSPSDQVTNPAPEHAPREMPRVAGTSERSAPNPGSSTRAALLGRVLVAAHASPAGLDITLSDERGNKLAPRRVDASGAFAFEDLAAGRVWLEASGLDDVVWLAPKLALELRAGERREIEWDLSDECPAIVDIVLKFDGLPCRGAVWPTVENVHRVTALVTQPTGTATWRTKLEGALSFFAQDFAPDQKPPRAPRFGTSRACGTTKRGQRGTCELDIRTSLVRVLPAGDGTVPTPIEADTWSCSIGMREEGETPSSVVLTLLQVPLSSTTSPLATFRAGPGRYVLQTHSVEGAWSAELAIEQGGATVDCRLARR